MPSVWKRFKGDKLAMAGLAGVLALVAMAVFAPLLANHRPFALWGDGSLRFPFLRYIFAPDCPERTVEKLFNYFILFLPLALLWRLLPRRNLAVLAGLAVVLTVPFLLTRTVVEKTDWRALVHDDGRHAVFAPHPYGPFESVGAPYAAGSLAHPLGTDQIGRDVLSRVIYGSRVAIAVGFLATAIALAVGTAVGLFSGYFGGKTDLVIMRAVEIIICFPSFLLLLILMAVMMDLKFGQSALIVVPVIGFLGWTGLSRLVRGETLKQRSLAYIQSAEVAGLPRWRIMFVHLLPNVSAPIFVSAVFMVAGNVLAESGLSFLGFGVQPPTASWGELLKEAFADPLRYWNLTLWPGLLIFLTVSSFNLAGEGLRKAVDPKSS